MSPLTNMFAIRANPLGILQGAPAYRKNPDEEILYGPNSRQAELNPGWTNNSGDVTKKSINEYYAKRPINMETVETDYPFLADPNFQVELNNILSQNPNINKKDIYQIMSGESSFNPTAKNPDSSATGLFQFIESTANNLGTTTDEISKMTPAQQLNLYGRYVNNYMRNSEKSPDFVININEDGSYEDFDEEAFEKMFPPLNKNAQDDSNNIVSKPIVEDIPVSPPRAIDMIRNSYREGNIERQKLSKEYKEGKVSDRPLFVPLFPKEPLTEREADVLKRAQDVNQQFNNEKNDMINAEKGYIPQQTTYSPPNRAGNKYSQRTGLNAVDYNGTVNPNVVYDSQGNPYDTTYNNKQEKYDPTGGQQQSRQDLDKLANFDISTIDGKEFVHERGLTEKQVMAEYDRRKQSNGAGNGVMPTGVGILQDMSNAVEVPFRQDDFAFEQDKTTGLDRARNLLGEPTTVYRDINGNLVEPNSEEQKPNNLRYLAGLLGSIMADRYGNPSQPEDNFSKYMKYTQDAIEQQRLDKQALESTFGNYRDNQGNIVLGGITPDGGFKTIPGFTAIDDSDSTNNKITVNENGLIAVDVGGNRTVMMTPESAEKYQEQSGKDMQETLDNLENIRATTTERANNFDTLLKYDDDTLNKFFNRMVGFEETSGKFRDLQGEFGKNKEAYKDISNTWKLIGSQKAKEAYVNILKGAGSISNYETDIMKQTIDKLNTNMSAKTLRKELEKLKFLEEFYAHNRAANISGYSDSKGTYDKLNTKEALKLFENKNNKIYNLNDYLNYKNRQK